MKNCKPEDHDAGSLSNSHKYLVCSKCLELFELDLSKWNAVKNIGIVRIIEHGPWPGEEKE